MREGGSKEMSRVMNEWMGRSMEIMGGRKDKWMDAWMEERLGGWTDGWMKERKIEWVNGVSDG